MIYFQFGTRGAFLNIPLNSLNYTKPSGYTIGDRLDITDIYAIHDTLGEYDLNGVWYVYGVSTASTGIVNLKLVRNSSKLAMRGDGSVIAANTVEQLYNIPGYKTDENFYITLRTDRTQYFSIVQAAYRLKNKAFPIFNTDGSVNIINMYDRGISNPSIYAILLTNDYQVQFYRAGHGVAEYETNKAILHVYDVENVFYPAGTIVKPSFDAMQAILIADITAVLGPNNTVLSTRATCILLDLS